MDDGSIAHDSTIKGMKAVLFTHLDDLRPDREPLLLVDPNILLRRYTTWFQAFFQAVADGAPVSLVYAYVDWAVRQSLKEFNPSAGEDFQINRTLLAQERRLIGNLMAAEAVARRRRGLRSGDPPKFIFVGFTLLLDLIESLIDIDPQLTDFLYGPQKEFTYDTPKFVEAVIRLVRGNQPHLADSPVIRLDRDVLINSSAIRTLCETYAEVRFIAPIFFFSGTYSSNGVAIPPSEYDTSSAYDPINDHAVRVHWFARKPDPSKVDRFIVEDCDKVAIRAFLADLDELGATQFESSADYQSSGLNNIISRGRERSYPLRTSRQVVSGAGLIMSSKAVRLLPPFMNLQELTVWIDDHLKRRLHEAVGDLAIGDVECVREATFPQDRHPGGITESDIDWASREYFERIIRGCIFRRVITELDGSPTEYSEIIRKILVYKIRTDSPELQRAALIDLGQQTIVGCRVRLAEIVEAWSSIQFNDFAHYLWAKQLELSFRDRLLAQVIADALRYMNLVVEWPVIVRAIDRLPLFDNYWLFEPGE